jgi:ABC-type cobalamin transport system ATPase subunit
LRLTPSGLEGVGDARLLPIAPLEQLLAGMATDTRQLAIASDGQFGNQLHLLGSQGIGTSQVIAGLPSALSTPGSNSLSG